MTLQQLAIDLANLIAAGAPLDFKVFPHRVTEFYDPARNLFIGTDASSRDLRKSYTNPLFIDQATGAPIKKPRPSLQSKLDDLIAGAVEPGNVLTQHQKNIGIALVSLKSDPSDLSQPEFAGWHEDRVFYAASSAKMALAYAAFQLRSEMSQLLGANMAIDDVGGLKTEAEAYWRAHGRTDGFPNLEKIFVVDAIGRAAMFGFNVPMTMLAFSGDEGPINSLIADIGFPYIASLMLQSGFYNPAKGGLWLGGDYSLRPPWRDNPFPDQSKTPRHSITPLAGATLFTLLAQGRLVSRADAKEMRDEPFNISFGGCFATDQGNHVATNIAAGKCGILDATPKDPHFFYHDVCLYDDGAKRYVMALMTIDSQPPLYYQIRDRVQALF